MVKELQLECEFDFCKEKLKGEDLIKHYKDKHQIPEDNLALLNYISSLTFENYDKVNQCIVCGHITGTQRAKHRHILKRHNRLYAADIKDIPIKIEKDTIETLRKSVYQLSIYRTTHFDDYNWASGDVVEAFLRGCKLIIDSERLKGNKLSNRITVSVSFTIVNKSTKLNTIKYLPIRSWTTTAIKTISLNENVLESLKSQIMSKIIQNGETGSHVTFSHFQSFNMNISTVDDADIYAVFGGNDDDKIKLVDYTDSEIEESIDDKVKENKKVIYLK